MKPSRAFWGTFFVVLGVLFLVGRSYDVSLGWGYVWKFWPLVFVFIGLAVMVKNPRVKGVLAGIAAIGVALFAYGAASFAWIDSIGAQADENTEGERVQEFSEPFSSTIKKASLTLDAAVGKYTIDTVADQLLNAKIKTSIGRYTLDRESANNGIHLRFKPEGQIHMRNWRHNRGMNVADIRLNTNPTWAIDLNIGAANVDFDLSPFNIENINVEAGAATVRLKLGALASETHCKVEAGASSMKISIPEAVGCEIRLDAGLSSKHFEGFSKVSDHVYRTENFEQSTKKIFIDAEAGVSSIRVVRY